ncbi:hypothetical protein JST97_23900 [bacterium]|nr:hypothetical protein [bacterium]
MNKTFSYSQRIQLALLVLFASLCLNFGQLLGHFRQPSNHQLSTTRIAIHPG